MCIRSDTHVRTETKQLVIDMLLFYSLTSILLPSLPFPSFLPPSLPPSPPPSPLPPSLSPSLPPSLPLSLPPPLPPGHIMYCVSVG